MQGLLKFFVTISALSTLVVAPVIFSAKEASAQPAVTTNRTSYVGAGVAAGLTNGGQKGDAANIGTNIQGRFAVPKVPLSVRGAVNASDETTSIAPILTYDMPVTRNANVYVGGGYSFVERQGKPTPLGNKNAPVLTTGIEAQVGKHFTVYSDAKLGIRAYKKSPASAVSVGAGVGVNF